MTKMQPTYSFQKYQEDPEDLYLKKEQFAKELSNQYVQAANAVNATIDDMSYFTRERPTGETWTDGRQIYTITKLLSDITGASPFPHGITGMTGIIDFGGAMIVGAFPGTTTTLSLPFSSASGNANVEVLVDATSITITAGAGFAGAFPGTFNGYIMIKYLKK